MSLVQETTAQKWGMNAQTAAFINSVSVTHIDVKVCSVQMENQHFFNSEANRPSEIEPKSPVDVKKQLWRECIYPALV